ncbi:MFS transporter [uncultured Pseudokineococcus sp.]|uniref:MFS transporter n=1 Tax=uncultured Pseudokineococcus sp. TaxID=1642928 RepID=UPI00262C4CD6|nr:MFS transporter [uncultured Pseudokineococcus sp.]
MSTTAAGWRADAAVLGVQPFRRLFASRLAAVLGNAMVAVALAFGLLDADGSGAGRVGLVLGARVVAQMVFLLAGGVLADRWPRRSLMAAAELVAGLSLAGVAVQLLVGDPPLGWVLALMAVNGAASALYMPAAAGIVPTLVRAGQLHGANSLLRLSENVGAVVGAALAGVLVAAAGAGWALVVTAVLYLVSAVLLAGMRARHVPRAEPPTLLGDLAGGWRETVSRQWVWVVVVQFSVVNACFSGLTRVLGPVVALQEYAGPASWSLVLTAEAVGLLVGGAVALRVRPRGPVRAGVLAVLLLVPPLVLLALQAPVLLVAAAMALGGVAVTVFDVLWATALQQHVPGEALSRVSSYDALGSFALAAVGLALVGPVSAVLGTRATLLAGAGLVAAATLAAAAAPGVRRLTAVDR